MRSFFPGADGIDAWHEVMLGRTPFPCDRHAAAAAFFSPAARVCRRPVPAEKELPASIPSALRRDLAMSLRFWQRSQEITEDFILRGKLLPGMDMPMTLNFAMALGNYSRHFLFSGKRRLPGKEALALHAAFAGEMALMPAAMAVRRPRTAGRSSPRGGRRAPAASAMRLAGAFAGIFGKPRL